MSAYGFEGWLERADIRSLPRPDWACANVFPPFDMLPHDEAADRYEAILRMLFFEEMRHGIGPPKGRKRHEVAGRS